MFWRLSPWMTAAWLVISALFMSVALQSPGFDDEMTNIELIENLGTIAVTRLMQKEDVHPPLGYLFNGLLFDVFGRWDLVRLASAALYMLSLAGFISFIKREHGESAAWLALGVAGLSPAALIWCTSLRWYAYFLPVLMCALTLPENRNGRWFIVKPALAWLLLSHISYASLALAPALFLWWALHSNGGLIRYAKRSAPVWLLAGLLFAPQAWILFNVHANNSAGQTSGLLKSLMGVGISLASNQGLFPLSTIGVASALSWSILYIWIARAAWLRIIPTTAPVVMLIAIVFFVASGLAGKYRNLVLLVPFQAFVLDRKSVV